MTSTTSTPALPSRRISRRLAPYAIPALALSWGCGSDSGTTPEPGPPPAVSVAVTPTATDVFVGATTRLSATVQNSTAGVTWASDQTGVATVDGSGLVSGVAPGTARITATSTADATKSATATITVKRPPPQVVAFAPEDGATDVGVDAVVTVTFSQPVELGASPDEIVVMDAAGTSVPTTLDWDEATSTVTVTPAAPGLTELRTVYTVTVSGVRNAEGTPMTDDAASTFTTVFADPAWTYRLYNERTGPDFVLDNFADTPICYLAAVASNTSGSFWTIAPALNPAYRVLQSLFGGPDQALEAADGVDPCLLTGFPDNPNAYFTGQAWTFTPVDGGQPGAFRMQTQSWGVERSLDVYDDGRDPEQAYMAPTADAPGQYWHLIRAFRPN